ncbi:transposase [Desulfofundulus thermocisternus]|uniref:transposase n=1 Tax=Desulfofundulus thermocisternus TaxID=42471 RepID=UPI00217F036E|nr:transposase [Desulfofundulus thermocisternus]MCS5695794.1 transposase [Desulfofundulus thermocisternus]
MYRPSKEEQLSFYHPDLILPRMFGENNFYHLFREKCDLFIKDVDFTPLYCPDNGRPAASPAILFKALILQRLFDLSDRKLEEACRYDLRFKYILGLELDDMGFDHSIFGRFRDRLLQSEKHKEAFFKLLELLVDEGLVKEKEKQRVDSTHIIANVAVPAATELIRQGVRQCLIEMKRKDHAVFLQARQTLTELVHQYLSGKMAKKQMEQVDETKRRQRLTAVVKDARELLAFLDKRDNLHPAVEYRRTILQRLLYENVMPDENGGYREQKESHPDRVISAVDPEARHGAKSATKKFNGYKVHFTESTENKIITNLKVTPGNVNDA